MTSWNSNPSPDIGCRGGCTDPFRVCVRERFNVILLGDEGLARAKKFFFAILQKDVPDVCFSLYFSLTALTSRGLDFQKRQFFPRNVVTLDIGIYL